MRTCTTSPSRLLMVALSIWSMAASRVRASGSSGLRGAQDDQRQLDLIDENGGVDPSANSNDCGGQLSLTIGCEGDCNLFGEQEGTCASKMFQYHGGPCRSALSEVKASSDTAANCLDFHQGPPTAEGEAVFVVISDVNDPTKNSSMWTTVGGYFQTGMHSNGGWSDMQNVTFYSSDDETMWHHNMLQTMLFEAPCHEGTPLEQLDQGQSVRLIATAVDPTIRVQFDLQVSSLTEQEWQLQQVAVISDAKPSRTAPQYQEVPLEALDSTSFGLEVYASLPLAVEVDRNDTLVVLATATAVTSTGRQCSVSALYDSGKGHGSNR